MFLFFKEGDVVQLKYNIAIENISERLSVAWKNSKSGEWETNVSYAELTEDELQKEWVCLRTKFQLKYAVVSNGGDYHEQLRQLLQTTRTKICETNKPVLKVIGTEIVLKKEKGLVGIGKNAKISAAVQQTKNEQNSATTQANKFEVLNIEVAAGEQDASTVVDDISLLFSSECNEQFNSFLI